MVCTMRFFPAALAASLLLVKAFGEFPEYKHPVMTWVPPYGIAKAKARLGESMGGVKMQGAVTHLGLQFWTPTKNGGVERVQKYGPIDDATIQVFRKWGNTNGVRVMLCVYNGVEQWDWALARAAFADHREAFATALVAEAKRLDLDGIDIDLEGNGSFDADREAFVRFVADLAQRCKAADLALTVDSFAYIWNAPNQTWWKSLLPLVDALTTMGYEETGAKADGWRAFAAQKKAAGEHTAKLMIGLPANEATWQGSKAAEHLRALRELGVGAAVWDAQLESPAWRTKETWSVLREIRGAR